jgi:Plasmid pRiA4b ORF-3-like protein
LSRTWLSIKVVLIEGRGNILWPRPGRLFATSRAHTFAQLAEAIDAAFARWDLAHLHEFRLKDGTRIGVRDDDGWDEADEILDDGRTKLIRLTLGEQFSYTFDFGDGWLHLCTVGPTKIDPLEALGIVPDRPLSYFGWGAIPDQYGRRWDGDVDDDEESPADPQRSDLPPLEPGWGEPAAEAGPGHGHAVRLHAVPVGQVEVVLREADRALLQNDTLCDPELVEKLRPGRSSGKVIGHYTPAELDDLLGFVAGEFNHARSRKLRARLDDLYARLEEFEDRAGPE